MKVFGRFYLCGCRTIGGEDDLGRPAICARHGEPMAFQSPLLPRIEDALWQIDEFANMMMDALLQHLASPGISYLENRRKDR